jgi:hypothetical protein
MTAPTATDLEDLVRAKLLGASTLLTLLADGSNSVFPRAGVSPDGSTETPFIVIKYGSKSGAFPRGTSWAAYVYDVHGRRYWRIRAILHALHRLFHENSLGPSAPGYTQYPFTVLSTFESTPLTDGGWDKDMMFKRFNTTGL